MSDPIRIVGTVTGGEEAVARFLSHGDAVRNGVKRGLARLGTEAKRRAAGLAPRSSGYRSPGSKKVGPLYKKILSKVTSGDQAAVKLMVRPRPFYALFLEGGVTRAPYRKNHTNALGEAGAMRRVVVGRGYAGKNAKGERVYNDGFAVGAHQRRTVIRDDYGAAIGTKFQSVKARKVSAYSFKKTTQIAARPFMAPVSEWVRSQAQGRIDEAVKEALRGD